MSLPQIQIIEQPAEKSFRFRYESENRGSGSLTGVRSGPNKISYPKVKIQNFTGLAVIVVSCVTNDKNPQHRQHPHKLSSKKNSKNGVYMLRMDVNQSAIAEFKDIGIIFVKRENIKTSLEERRRANIDPTNGGWDHMNRQQKIDLHCVRLCFQLFSERKCESTGKSIYTPLCGCVVSNPIMDKKSHGSLKMVELSSSKSSAAGGDRIMIFTDRIKREDIDVVFYEEDSEKNVIWKQTINYKNSTKLRIHHQYGISLVTPEYRDIDIQDPRKAFIQLYRPSDSEFSEPFMFEFVPTTTGHTGKLRRKRQKKENDIDVAQVKYVPNIRESNGNINRNNATKQLENPQPLIDLSDNDEKENYPILNTMQNYRSQNNQQTISSTAAVAAATPARPFETQYNNYPSNTQRVNDNQYYYPPYPQHLGTNSHFEELNNMQLPYHPRPTYVPNIYQQQQQYHHQQQQQHQQQHQQQQQHQSQLPNVYSNNGVCEFFPLQRLNIPPHHQPVNSAMNYAPSTYHENYNNQPNKQPENFINTITETTDSNAIPNFSNIDSDLVNKNTNELIEAFDEEIDMMRDSLDKVNI